MRIVSGGDGIPLTAAQAGIWYAQQLDPENPVFNAAEYLEIRGSLDATLFEGALRRRFYRSGESTGTRLEVEVLRASRARG